MEEERPEEEIVLPEAEQILKKRKVFEIAKESFSVGMFIIISSDCISCHSWGYVVHSYASCLHGDCQKYPMLISI